MIKILLTAAVLFASSFLHAQPWLKRDIPVADQEEKKPSLKALSHRFNEFWKDKEISSKENENADEGGYQQFRRWEWFMRSRTYPDGYFFPPEIAFQEYQKTRKSKALRTSTSSAANWSFIGPTVVPSGGGGVGRVNVIRIHPQNPNIIFLGAACGGIWKTTDGGLTWTSLDDFLPSLSIADIAINPRYPDSVYVATGDGYGYESGPYDFWGGLYTAGILVSPDGGITWNQTGWSRVQADRDIIQRLQVNPADPNILLICTRNGIFRSLNAGATWSLVRSGHFYDIEFRPGSADTIYTSNGAGIFRSVNRGQSFTQLNTGLGGGRLSIAVTPANPNVVYTLSENGVFKKSVNGGVTMTATAARPDDVTTFYGYYDCVLAVSPVEENVVFAGGLDGVKSTDGGNTWVQVTNTTSSNNVHVDFHSLEFIPGTPTLFAGTDGGIWKTLNYGTRWTNLSNGLGIKQYYRICHSKQNPYTIYAGSQDNGTDQFKNGLWKHVTGGDGMDNAINYNDDSHVITSYQYGAFLASDDGGQSFNNVAPATGAWVTPIIVDPVDPTNYYAGYQDVWKSTDHGFTWNPISNLNAGNDLVALDVSGQDHIYAATESQLWASHDGGSSWAEAGNGLPSSLAINFISASPVNGNDVWIGFSGYDAAQKVYHSTDGGLRWENFSTGLPNVPVNSVMVNPFATDGIFAGTDLGVYYSEAGSNWILYGNGLPPVIISDLDVITGLQKIRAGTYGRGMWEADLPVTMNATEDAAIVKVDQPRGEWCTGTISPSITIKNFGSNTLTSLQINYGVDGDTSLVFNWSGSLAQGVSDQISLPAITVINGDHTFVAYCSYPNGVVDMNGINDLRSTDFSVSSSGFALPVIESFEGNNLETLDHFFAINSGNLLSVSGGGSYSQSSFSLKASFFHSSSGTAILSTRHLDLSNAINPTGLRFDYAYAPYSSLYHDSLFVKISVDCGSTWNLLVAKGDNSLSTAASQTTPFYPLGSDWRTETIDLSSYVGNPDVIIRFEFNSGFGNNLYLDNINIIDNADRIENANSGASDLQVFPNPAAADFRVVFNSTKDYVLRVSDMTGRIVFATGAAGVGVNSISVPANTIEPGMYLVILTKGNEAVEVRHLIKK